MKRKFMKDIRRNEHNRERLLVCLNNQPLGLPRNYSRGSILYNVLDVSQ